MWDWIRHKAADLLNEAIDPALCPVRLSGLVLVAAMSYKLVRASQVTGDLFQGFGIGAAAVLTAIVAKQFTETRNAQSSQSS